MLDINFQKKYNVLFLMNGAKPPRGGEFLTLYLITHLRRDLFNPILVYAHEGAIVQEIKKADIESVQIPLGNRITSIYPREIKLYNPFFILTFLWHLFLSRGIFKLNKLLKENNIHLIYCADNLSKLIGGIAGKMAGVKVVAHCYDDFKEDTLGKTMRMFYLMLLDRILTVSDKVKKFFPVKEGGGQKAITVYVGIDTNLFDPDKVNSSLKKTLGIDDKEIIIGSIGALDRNKGQIYLLRALDKLKIEGINNISCVICGTGKEDYNLKKFVEERGLSQNVYFLGFRNDIPNVLKTMDIMIVTSSFEAFPLSVIEAMSMKVPVIATNVGGIPEAIDDGENGMLVPHGNIDALCEAIKYLVNNPETRLKMGENGRARVLEKFTIEQNVRKTEDVFLSLMVT